MQAMGLPDGGRVRAVLTMVGAERRWARRTRSRLLLQLANRGAFLPAVVNRHGFTARCFDTRPAPTGSGTLPTNWDGPLRTRSHATRLRNQDRSLAAIVAEMT